jgi:hypothetical protein
LWGIGRPGIDLGEHRGRVSSRLEAWRDVVRHAEAKTAAVALHDAGAADINRLGRFFPLAGTAASVFSNFAITER